MLDIGRTTKRLCKTGRQLALCAGFVAAASAVALVCATSSWGATTYAPALDFNSMSNTTLFTGAQAYWNAGYTGKGVDVAVIDSGVSPVQGLSTSGKVIYGPDLSLESQASNLRNLDTYGHGTFMAGLIAGHDSTLVAPYASAPASQYRGMAPDARIVSLKVATADGGTDVSQVVAAIDWVIQHRTDHGMNIRVLNLSYGTNSGQSYLVDPLAYAIEQAWNAGIFVVASAGNAGYVGGLTGNLGDPAYDPFVLAVGAADPMGTSAIGDDQVATFSAKGGKKRKIDLVTPGSHLQGLRVPGSFIDKNHPEGLIDSRYFRGSGTSQAAAIASGEAALLIQQRPSITPGQLKLLLMNSCVSLSASNEWQGRGEPDLKRALTAASTMTDSSHTPSSGTGSLELSRGVDHLTRAGVMLSGEQDIFGRPFDASASTWSGGVWHASTWSGSTWSGNTWSASTWSGSSWSGNTWSASTWSSNTWSGSSWSGNTWSGSSWSGSTWSGNTWSTGSWQGATWG